MKRLRLGKTTPADNEAPPTGPIVLDLHGTSIPHAYQQYTVSFVATSATSFISFAFRDDPDFLALDDISVTTSGGPNLVVNGGFESGPLGDPAPVGWTYLNEFAATFSGVVAGTSTSTYSDPHSGSYYYRDGSVQAYDVITQQIPTTIGHTYTISFWLCEESDATTFRRLSDNGGLAQFGNGVNVIVYAGDSQPTWGPGPSLESCIASIFEPGNPGNATDTGSITPPRFPRSVAIVEAAAATDGTDVHVPTVYSAAVSEIAPAGSAQDAELPTVVLARNTVVAGLEPVRVSSMSAARRLGSGTMVIASAVPTVYSAAMFELAAASDRPADATGN